MSVADTVKRDLAVAMKAGERERVGALRLVLSELQKAAKEGNDDEVAVLRRERKRRLEAATAFREGGRPDRGEQEESEATIIGSYLPAELSDEELDRIIADAIAQAGGDGGRSIGPVMKLVMTAVQGRADGGRVSARVREALG